MNRRFPFARMGALVVLCTAFGAGAQTPAPPVPKLTKEQKEAAAAIEAPKTFAPPPMPGQLQGGEPVKPAAPAPPAAAPAPAPAATPESSASKMEALDAITKKPTAVEAPHVSAPSDKIPITSSTSTSRQFIVHGKVFETRSAMSSRCEEISTELRKVLDDKEPWVIPIVVLLNTGEEAAKTTGPPVSTAISELTHGGFHLQVTVNERAGLNADELRKEIVRALLAERILRNHQKISMPEGRLLLPDWVMTGVLQAMNYRASARPSAMFATIFRSGKIYGIEEIIEASPVEMDGLSRTIYETSCCALVLALIDQPNGASHFNKFLNALASDPRSERELLSAAFPSFAASASSLNKWWSLQLAALSKPGIAEPYTAAESLKAIEEAITIRYEAPAAEVPKNIKMHPFVLPAPLPVIADSPPTPAPTSNSQEPSKSKTKETAGVAEEAPADKDEKPRRSILRRLLFLGDPEVQEKDAESKSDEKPVTKAADEKADKDKAEEEKKPGFIARLFGAGGEEKKEPEKVKAAEVEKPKTAVQDEPETKEEKKPSKLNPLNWFRGDKKPAEEEKTDGKADGEEQASAEPSDRALDLARLLSPSLADAWHWLSPEAPHLTKTPLLDFFKGKSKDKSKDEKPAEPAKKEEPKKAASKPETKVKEPAKPRTTNPNSKPASRPSPSSSDAPHTTNPNAKPVPAGAMPPAAGNAAAKPAMVPVVLPLEEYQHILKHPDRVNILNYNIASLRALELRVSILFRPVVAGYLAAVLDLQQGKTKDMDKRLETLHAFALVAYQKSVAVRDYLDWFEASESGSLSGKFEDFLNLPATIQKELPERTDPISKYLDAIDKEFTK